MHWKCCSLARKRMKTWSRGRLGNKLGNWDEWIQGNSRAHGLQPRRCQERCQGMGSSPLSTHRGRNAPEPAGGQGAASPALQQRSSREWAQLGLPSQGNKRLQGSHKCTWTPEGRVERTGDAATHFSVLARQTGRGSGHTLAKVPSCLNTREHVCWEEDLPSSGTVFPSWLSSWDNPNLVPVHPLLQLILLCALDGFSNTQRAPPAWVILWFHGSKPQIFTEWWNYQPLATSSTTKQMSNYSGLCGIYLLNL